MLHAKERCNWKKPIMITIVRSMTKTWYLYRHISFLWGNASFFMRTKHKSISRKSTMNLYFSIHTKRKCREMFIFEHDNSLCVCICPIHVYIVTKEGRQYFLFSHNSVKVRFVVHCLFIQKSTTLASFRQQGPIIRAAWMRITTTESHFFVFW